MISGWNRSQFSFKSEMYWINYHFHLSLQKVYFHCWFPLQVHSQKSFPQISNGKNQLLQILTKPFKILVKNTIFDIKLRTSNFEIYENRTLSREVFTVFDKICWIRVLKNISQWLFLMVIDYFNYLSIMRLFDCIMPKSRTS